MFLGTYLHILDAKNRLALPAKLAAKLTSSVVVSKGFDHCLELRTLPDFETYSTNLMKYSDNKKDIRVVVRKKLGNAAEIVLDKQNRILIPANLLAEASIKKDITIIGVGNKLEIWDSNTYKKYSDANEKNFEAIAERIDNDQ